MPKKEHRIGLSVSAELYDAILKQADLESRTLASFVRHTLSTYIAAARKETSCES